MWLLFHSLLEKGVGVRLKLDVQGQRVWENLDVDGQGVVGGLEG